MRPSTTPDYKGYSVEPLVYLYVAPKQGKLPRVRRYRAAVTITELATQEKQVAKLAVDYEFFGDARRAAVMHGQEMIDHPEAADALMDTPAPPQAAQSPEASAPIEASAPQEAPAPAQTPAPSETQAPPAAA
jgi:hypothetical protein